MLKKLQDAQPAVCRQLFGHLLDITAPAAVTKMNRYSKLKAGLRMLSLNAPRFSTDIFENATKLFESKSGLTTHSNLHKSCTSP